MAAVDTSWYAPSTSWITDLDAVVNGTGVHGFIFNSSNLPSSVQYGAYNWCNMPHVRMQEYHQPSADHTLQYVEVIHRHHKRTPYASNTFPHESYSWDCSDERLFYYGRPFHPQSHIPLSTYWDVYTSNANPLAPTGFNGSCQFPQITRGGLEDSWQHGKDLFTVYHDLLGFLPDQADESVSFRVTNNVITSQVAGMLISAMYPTTVGPFSLKIQPASIDSLEPKYSCPYADSLSANYSAGSDSVNWTVHLNASKALFTALDAISNVPEDDDEWHRSWDHYFDNISARQCHNKPLPCNVSSPSLCVTQDQADSVYRLGQYEYAYIWRGAPQSMPYATAAYGIWAAELTQNLRDVISGESTIKYRHNVAHDGSISRLLALLQVEIMVWPGMGAELVFELWKGPRNENLLRVLWGGQPLRSSNPSFGAMDMINVDVFLAYVDTLVGQGAVKVPAICQES